MRASAIEFRLRMAINAAIIVLGFWAPWIAGRGSSTIFAQRIPLLEWLALEWGRTGLVRFTVAAPAVVVLAAAIAGLGAVLRVWGTAYLGTGTVTSMAMKAGRIVADGPYRYARNPLYLGLWFMVAGIAFLMPVTGALFSMALITVFLLRLILAEEAFLGPQMGDMYKVYLRAVPRIFPRLHATPGPGGGHPHWLRAALAEIMPIGVFVALAFLSWTYDNRLMTKAILISFGLSLIARALMPARTDQRETAE
jgi:protein-S-isoprenylcysteine O-methyltransferase Ste14